MMRALPWILVAALAVPVAVGKWRCWQEGGCYVITHRQLVQMVRHTVDASFEACGRE